MAEDTRLKVLLAHNHYAERGGEDESFEAERRLLQQNGHELREYTRANSEIDSYSLMEYASLPFRTIWARDSYRDIGQLIRSEKPSVAHFNNTFPLISPSAYDACRDMNVPVIQNIRNYRLVCPNALFFRDHHICEDCLGRRFAWPGILHACYRDSRIQSSVVAVMLAYHRLRKTWQEKVDVFIALTQFARGKLIAGGIPAEKIVVKPNFVYDHGVSEDTAAYALFIGRIVEGKGILNLLNAWKYCQNIPLKLVGDGPLLPIVREIVEKERLKNVEICGSLPTHMVFSFLKGARFLVFPPLWYEAFPRVLIEAFSCGKPVIASSVGAATEIVADGRVGSLFAPNDPMDLAQKVNSLWENLEECRAMGLAARSEYEQKYTPERNYEMLMNIYQNALNDRRK